MMRTAILIAILATVPAWSYGADDTKPKPAGQPAQDQQVPPVAQSPKATIPAAPPAAESPKSGGIETDPSKMAAPAATDGAKLPGTAPVDVKGYTIGAEDVLFIQVWMNRDLTQQVIVRPDGKITVGLIGEVVASGMTPEKLGQEISQRLKDGGFLRSPQVSVGVHQINSKKYFILGEVNKPGSFPLVVPTTVLEALVNAGGFKDFANKKKILINRGDTQLRFNYTDVIKGKNRKQNILLEPGDQIIVK